MKLSISTHSGIERVIEVDNTTDIQAINEQRNNHNIEAIYIGGDSYSRIDLKNIIQIREATETL